MISNTHLQSKFKKGKQTKITINYVTTNYNKAINGKKQILRMNTTEGILAKRWERVEKGQGSLL